MIKEVSQLSKVRFFSVWHFSSVLFSLLNKKKSTYKSMMMMEWI